MILPQRIVKVIKRFSKRVPIAQTDTRNEISSHYNEEIYLRDNPDVVAAINEGSFPNGYRHWSQFGFAEYKAGLRKPGFMPLDDVFDETTYLEANPDVLRGIENGAFVSGYQHWVLFGRDEYKEGRRQLNLSKSKFLEWKPEIQIAGKEIFLGDLKRNLLSFLDSKEKLDFATSQSPVVSVVIVACGGAELVLKCLQSLIQECTLPLEIILVNNGCDATVSSLLEKSSGIRVLELPNNVFYLKAVNLALGECKGKYVLLLNSDTEVMKDSILAAVQTIESASDIGAVGGKILLVDGSLQEAGSIVWKDGSCLGYGRHMNPEKPQYMFQRQVDYCSGAFLLVKRELFMQVGGFREELAPMYYEDVDLCLLLKEMGFKTIYAPRVIVRHFEFGSSNSTDWRLRTLLASREKFVTLHKALLETKPEFSATNVLPSRDGSRPGPRILIIEDAIPLRRYGSGFPRIQNIIHLLTKRDAFITFCPMGRLKTGAFSDPPTCDEIYSELPIGTEVFPDFEWNELESFLKARQGYYDFLIVCRPHNMAYVAELFSGKPSLFENIKIVYDAEAIFARRDILFSELQGHPISDEKKDKMIKRETSLASVADSIITVCQEEARCFDWLAKDSVHTLGYPVQAELKEGLFHNRKDLLFIGPLHDDHTPNSDAVLWFATEILPLINEQTEEKIYLDIAGLCASEMVRQLAGPYVRFLGFVENMQELCNRHKFMVAPIRFSAGIPLKVIEAAAAGIPVVGTKHVANQLNWQHSKELLIADQATAFADNCLRLYSDQILWNKLRHNSFNRVIKDYSHTSASEVITKIFFDSKEQIEKLQRFSAGRISKNR